jgi:iron complex transport system substrate-binding protein
MARMLALALTLGSALPLHAATITDDVGRRVDINIPVKTVICLSPAHTEMIYWLGCGGRLIADSKNCDYPAEAIKLPKAGTFLNPDIETITKLKPDLVISGGGIQKKAVAALESLGIKVVVMYPRSLNAITHDMKIIAGLLGCGGAENKIKAFAQSIKKRVLRSKIKVYVELWGQPPMSAGGQSFLNDVIESAGGVNILKDTIQEFPKISAEEVIKRQPDLIILLYDPEPDFMKREYIKLTPAGKNKKVFIIGRADRDCSLRPGPRINKAVEVFNAFFKKGEK